MTDIVPRRPLKTGSSEIKKSSARKKASVLTSMDILVTCRAVKNQVQIMQLGYNKQEWLRYLSCYNSIKVNLKKKKERSLQDLDQSLNNYMMHYPH